MAACRQALCQSTSRPPQPSPTRTRHWEPNQTPPRHQGRPGVRRRNHSRKLRGETRPYSGRSGTGERAAVTPTTGAEQGRHHPSPSTGSGRGTQASTPQQAGKEPENYSSLRENYIGTFPHRLRPAAPPEGLRNGRISVAFLLVTVDGEWEERGKSAHTRQDKSTHTADSSPLPALLPAASVVAHTRPALAVLPPPFDAPGRPSISTAAACIAQARAHLVALFVTYHFRPEELRGVS
jgi:hypothetical protein